MSIPFKEARAENFRAASRRPSDICYLVIHFTANDGDSAKNNADYFAREAPGASAHFFVDEREIWQSVQEKDIAWHCGTRGMYFHPYCRNANSLGVELCSRKRGEKYYFTPETVKNAQQFVRSLMKRYGIPTENVVRHYDVTGKWCPRPWMGDDTNTYYGTSGNEQWKKFKERLSGEELDMNIEEARKQLTSCADTGDTPSEWARDAAEFCKRKGIFNGDGAGNYGWQQPITREAVAQILYNAFESAGMLDAIPDKK